MWRYSFFRRNVHCEINNININKADTGIATKDSSVLRLKNALLKNTKICLAAYKKKQEFNGGIIEGEKVDCKIFN